MQANEIIAKYAAAEARCVAIAESENPFEMATEYAPGLEQLRAEWKALPVEGRKVLFQQRGWFWSYAGFVDKHKIDSDGWATRLKKLWRRWQEREEERRQARAVPSGHVPPVVQQAVNGSAHVQQRDVPLPTAPPVLKPPVAPAQSAAPSLVNTRPLPRPKVRPPGRRLEEEKLHVPSPAPEEEAPPRRQLVVMLPRAATEHIRRARSHTPSEGNEEDEEEGQEEEQEENGEDEEQEEQEEEASWSPPPVKRKSRSKAVPQTPVDSTTETAPTRPLTSTRKLVAVPTDALHHPPCGECDRRELDCVVNITGGACCLCRKHKRRCEYSKPRPKKPASRNPVSGPDEGTAPPVPRTSVLRKTRFVDPGSDSETPPRKKVNKGKQRATSTSPGPSRYVPSPSPPISNTHEDGPTDRPLVPPGPVSPDPNLQASIARLEDRIVYLTNGVHTTYETMHIGFANMVERLERLENVEEKVMRLTEMLEGLAGAMAAFEPSQARPVPVPTIVPGPSASVPVPPSRPVPVPTIVPGPSASVPLPPSSPLSRAGTTVQASSILAPEQAGSATPTVPPEQHFSAESLPPATSEQALTSVPSPAPVPPMTLDHGEAAIDPPAPTTPIPQHAVPTLLPSMNEDRIDVPCPPHLPELPGTMAQVRPGVNLISPTPQNSQEEEQRTSEILAPAESRPTDGQAIPSQVPEPEAVVPPVPVPPITSRSHVAEGRLVVPSPPGDPPTTTPSLRRSPRGLSPSPTPSTNSNAGDKKRKQGPGAASGSGTKKIRR